MMRRATVFQAIDLNRRGRMALDAAHAGEALVRDKDGFICLRRGAESWRCRG